MTNLIIKYIVDRKVSSQYKNLITATLKHACEINDIVLNWKKIKKFINSERTGNETNGRDRGYTHDEIQKILEFSDQRLKTAFLVLTSTGIRIGALRTLRVGDLEKIDDIYKLRVYSVDKEEYITFCTPECAKEIDTYLDFRKRHGEKITDDSFSSSTELYTKIASVLIYYISFNIWTLIAKDKVAINKCIFIILMVVMEYAKKKESPKDDSSNLGLRARVAFAATADETEESEIGSIYEEGLTNEGLHKYVDEAIDEVNKTKSNSSRAREGKTHQTS